jgi:hypothetical protein
LKLPPELPAWMRESGLEVVRCTARSATVISPLRRFSTCMRATGCVMVWDVACIIIIIIIIKIRPPRVGRGV